jgi:hypothetical protein
MALESATSLGTAPAMRKRFVAVLRRFANPYRLASYVLVLYALGHTVGAVISTPRLGAAADAVAASMKSVHFDAQGFNDTWYGFYQGFGWLVSVFFLVSAVTCWHIGGRPVRDRMGLAGITWPLFLSYAVSVVIACEYFFGAPIVFSGTVAILLGIACVYDIVACRALDGSEVRQ